VHTYLLAVNVARVKEIVPAGCRRLRGSHPRRALDAPSAEAAAMDRPDMKREVEVGAREG